MTNDQTCTPDCIVEFGIHSVECQKAFYNKIGVALPETVAPTSEPEWEPLVSSLCSICEQPIGKFSIQIAGLKEICIDCGNCATCGEQVTIAEINLAVSNGFMVQHSRCRMKTNPNAKIPVDEKELTLLNLCRLIIVPDVDISIETNTNRAILNWNMLWETLTLEQKYIHVQMIENVYQSAYLALKKEPTKVKNELRERDIERTTNAHADAKKARATQLPSERIKLGKQGKFLAAMLASGVTKEDAVKIWVSQGRVWVE